MFWVPKVVSWAESPFLEKKVWESPGLEQEHDVHLQLMSKESRGFRTKRIESGEISKLLGKTLKVNVVLVVTVTLNENL